jgi:hypothetical protein
MLFPMSCKYSKIWLCHPGLFRKTELLPRNRIFTFRKADPALVSAKSILAQAQDGQKRESHYPERPPQREIE